MKLKAFSVFDVKVDAYKQPFFLPTNGAAVRAFADAVNDEKTEVSRHPEDYKLICLGEFDDETGILSPSVPQSLGFGTEYVRSNGTVIGAIAPERKVS